MANLPPRGSVRRLPAFWVLLGLLILGLLTTGLVVALLAFSSPKTALMAVVLFTLHGLIFFLLIRAVDYLEPEPPWLVVTALAWGGLVAVGVASIANSVIDKVFAKLASPVVVAYWGAAVSAPIAEEGAKALGIVMLLLLAGHQINSVVDGMVYGAFIGLGFEEIENIEYAVAGVDLAGGGDLLGPVLLEFGLRGFLLGMSSHVVFTAIVGASIAWAYLHRDRTWPQRLLVVLLGFTAAWTGHFLINSPLLRGVFSAPVGLLIHLTVFGVLTLGLFVLIARWALRGEAGFYARRLHAVADPKLATEGEITALVSPAPRFLAQWNAYVREGLSGLRAMRRLQRGQANLALALSREMASSEGTRVVRPEPADQEAGSSAGARWRAEILAARQALAVTGSCPGAINVSRPGAVLGWTTLIAGLAGLGILLGLGFVLVPAERRIFPLLPVLALVSLGVVLPLFVAGVWQARRSGQLADVRLAIGLIVSVIGALPVFVLAAGAALGAS